MDLGGRSEADLLSICKGERERSIGFDTDPELNAARIEALDYYKGVMPDLDRHVRPGRSTAHSTDVADTVDTILPELMEIFVGGDDVVSFDPQNAKDVDAAQQETEYLHNVIFTRNNGFLTSHSFVKDALLSKTGLVTWWWNDKPEVENEVFEGKTAIEVKLAAQDGELINLTFDGEPITDGFRFPPGAVDMPVFGFEMAKEGPDGWAECANIAPEDFTCSRDTVRLSESTYCAFRSYPRAQKLIADGHDRALVDSLPAYGVTTDQRQQQARDTAGENLFITSEAGAPDYDLRAVELVTHFVRLLDGDGRRMDIWRVVTGAGETILVDAEKVDRVRIAAITPNIITHRFYGRSIADVMAEIARIKTSVLRMALDHGYFALNQRQYVDLSQANEFTLSDLLDNRPGRPVRGKGPAAVTPLTSGGQPYDFFGALEYLSTMGEARSGAIRNSTGLNPDTLHDTANGAAQQLAESLKRIRFIARIFAETGFKDWFLGMHALIRQHATQPIMTRFRGSWMPVDPTTWAERNDMTVEIGVGSGGRMQKQAALTAIVEDQRQIAAVPGGSHYVTPENQYRSRMDLARVMGLKSAEAYYTDPQTVRPPAGPPAPSPELLKLQADQQGSTADRAQALQIAQMQDDMEKQKLLAAHVQQQDKLAAETHIKALGIQAADRQAERDHEFQVLKLQTDTGVKVRDTDTKAHTAVEVAEIAAHTAAQGHLTDLHIQASESADVAAEAHRDRAHDMATEALGHLADHHAAAADRGHEVGMLALGHMASEHAADLAAERAPEPGPKGDRDAS